MQLCIILTCFLQLVTTYNFLQPLAWLAPTNQQEAAGQSNLHQGQRWQEGITFWRRPNHKGSCLGRASSEGESVAVVLRFH